MNKRKTGAVYEDIAASFLERKNIRILVRNYRCHTGEIDLIGMDEETLVFIEVKFRADHEKGAPEEAVTASKQRTIFRVAQFYMLEHDIPEDTPCRMDVIAIDGNGEIRHYVDAFGGI